MLGLFRQKYQRLISNDLPNACGHLEDASLKIVDININNWLGGAENDVYENFVADRYHGLRIMRLWRVAFEWETTSGIDARVCACHPTCTYLKS